MAEVVKDAVKLGSGRRAKYPWDDWADGQVWRATKGEDFDVEVMSFQTAVHQVAKRLGKRAATRIEGDSVVFRIFDDSDA